MSNVMNEEKSPELLAEEKEKFTKRSYTKAEHKEHEESLANMFARVNLPEFNSTKWVDISSFTSTEEMDTKKLQFECVEGAVFPRLMKPQYPTADSYALDWYGMTYSEVLEEVERAKSVPKEDKDNSSPIGKNGHRIDLYKMRIARNRECEKLTNETAKEDIENQKRNGETGIPFSVHGKLIESSDDKLQTFVISSTTFGEG